MFARRAAVRTPTIRLMGHLLRRLAPLLLCIAVVGGCASLGDVMDLSKRVQDAGYRDVSVNHSSNNGFDSLSISASGKSGADPDEIGRIVWDTYPEHIDELRLDLDGKPLVATEAQLRSAFGDRKVTEKPDDDEAAAKQIVMWVGIGIAVFLLLVIGVIILIIVLVRRSKRRRMPPPPPQYPPYYQP